MEAPDNYYHQAGFCSQFPTEKHHSLDSNKSAADHFVVEDLLDFSKEDDAVVSDGIINNGSSSFDAVRNNSTDSSTVTVVDSCNSSSGGDIGCHKFPPESHFGSELCVPYDDLAELEWLSNFVEESFSSEDLQKMQLISGMKATRPEESSETGNFQLDQNGDDNCHNINTAIAGDGNNNNPIFHPEMLVPAKARSKRSRNAPCNWASRLLMLSPTTSSSEPEIVVGGSASHPLPHPTSGKKTVKAIAMVQKKKDGGGGGSGSGSGGEGVAVAGNNAGDGRRCLHCATDKTPQWRTGPMGPKTLCNACGVRYKSGRLVPEYRPAASPTFVLTKHSNSHRKVLELRRQKEMMRSHEQHHPQQFLHHHQNIVFDVSNGDDYLIHQHVGPGFRQMI